MTSCCGLKEDEFSYSSAEKNPPRIVLRKVRGHSWILRRTKEREERDMEDEQEETAEPGLVMEVGFRQREVKPPVRTKRRMGCGRCAPCLRKDCGHCIYCQDMKKYGGPSRLKQKCQLRRCEKIRKNLTTETDYIQIPETITTATQLVLPETVKPRGPLRKWEENHQQLKHDGVQVTKNDKKERKMKRRRGKRKRRLMREDRKSQISPEGEGEEEEEAETPQCPLPVGPSGPLTGTHLQVNLSPDSSHLAQGVLSDSTPACLPGLLTQVSTDLTFIPPSPPPPPHAAVQSVQPKEEEEPVEIDLSWKGETDDWKEEEEPVEIDLSWQGRTGGWKEEEEVCGEGVSDKGRFYDLLVTLQDFDEEIQTAPSPNMSAESEADGASDVTAAVKTDEIINTRPEFLSLNSWSFSLFGGGACRSLTGGRGLLCLLHALRRTVLPAHWVVVLADRPELQLLQCSRLSSMKDTIVHVQSDRSFYISVQNQLLPETHRVFEAHAQRVSHLSQLVSLLLHLEQLVVCRGFRVRSSACRQQVRSAACHLLVAPPLYTCLPCLLEEEESEEEESEDEESEEDETMMTES